MANLTITSRESTRESTAEGITNALRMDQEDPTPFKNVRTLVASCKTNSPSGIGYLFAQNKRGELAEEIIGHFHDLDKLTAKEFLDKRKGLVDFLSFLYTPSPMMRRDLYEVNSDQATTPIESMSVEQVRKQLLRLV